MEFSGITVNEAMKLCKQAGLNIKRATVSKAFDSKRLDVSRPTARLRLATPESFQRWLDYQIEKYLLKNGLMQPDEATHMHIRTAKRLYTEAVKEEKTTNDTH